MIKKIIIAAQRRLERVLARLNKGGAMPDQKPKWKQPPYDEMMEPMKAEFRAFAEIGDRIEYMGREVYVVGHEEMRYSGYSWTFIPALEIKWFDNFGKLQHGYVYRSDLKCCKKIQAG